MRELHKPIRMCINCRVRKEQRELNRLQCRDGELSDFRNESGRSLYICNSCLIEREKSVVKRLSKLCRQPINSNGNSNVSIKIKEFVFNVKQSEDQ
jgi:predicted RNA-binding protein YlxR (DUF448 family)